MLQSLVEKQTKYSHQWTLRRLVFEPTHRYLFYSEELTHSIAEQRAIQDAIATCADITTTWKHKLKVTRIVREVELNAPDVSVTDFDMRNLYILHVEGYARKLRPEGLDKWTTATHAAFDEASPVSHRRTAHRGGGGGAVPSAASDFEDHLSDDEDIANDRDASSVSRWSFRFLSEAVFYQWFNKMTRHLEEDGAVDSKYCVDCPGIDPRFHLPIARLPLHLVHTMRVLEQFVFFALIRCTRVLLDDRKHRPVTHLRKTSPDAADVDELSLPDVELEHTGGELHLLRYQQAADYHEATYVLLTDHVLFYLRKDARIVMTLNLMDIDMVYYNTMASEPFVLFKTRDPLPDLLILLHPGSHAHGEINPLYQAYQDPTDLGRDGCIHLIECLTKLAPLAAKLRERGRRVAASAPALRQLQEKVRGGGGAAAAASGISADEDNHDDDGGSGTRTTTTTTTVAASAAEAAPPFECVGVNIFASMEEFVREEAESIKWHPRNSGSSSSVAPRIQVNPTPRWKLYEAIKKGTLACAAQQEQKRSDAESNDKSKSTVAAVVHERGAAAAVAPQQPPSGDLLGSPQHCNEAAVQQQQKQQRPVSMDIAELFPKGATVAPLSTTGSAPLPEVNITTTIITSTASVAVAPPRPSATERMTIPPPTAMSPLGLSRKKSNVGAVLLSPIQTTPPPGSSSSSANAAPSSSSANDADLFHLLSPNLKPNKSKLNNNNRDNIVDSSSYSLPQSLAAGGGGGGGAAHGTTDDVPTTTTTPSKQLLVDESLVIDDSFAIDDDDL